MPSTILLTFFRFKNLLSFQTPSLVLQTSIWDLYGLHFKSFFALKNEHGPELSKITNPHRHLLTQAPFPEPKSTNKSTKITDKNILVSELYFSSMLVHFSSQKPSTNHPKSMPTIGTDCPKSGPGTNISPKPDFLRFCIPKCWFLDPPNLCFGQTNQPTN